MENFHEEQTTLFDFESYHSIAVYLQQQQKLMCMNSLSIENLIYNLSFKDENQ
jgi:hypothetical protein